MMLTSDDLARADEVLQRLRRQATQDGTWREIDLLQRVVAEVRRHRWQPMATAPKDGTMILLFPSSCWTDDTKGDYEVSYWDTEEGRWHQWSHPDDYNGPTHWQPLPAAPVPDPPKET